MCQDILLVRNQCTILWLQKLYLGIVFPLLERMELFHIDFRYIFQRQQVPERVGPCKVLACCCLQQWLLHVLIYHLVTIISVLSLYAVIIPPRVTDSQISCPAKYSSRQDSATSVTSSVSVTSGKVLHDNHLTSTCLCFYFNFCLLSRLLLMHSFRMLLL